MGYGKRKSNVLESSQVSSSQRSITKKRKVGAKRSYITPSRNFPLPKEFVSNLRYVEAFSINPAIGTPSTYTFAANGLYDPNITGAGHQPMGFDQMTALYNHYEVIGAKISMTVVNSGTVEGFNCGVKLDDNGTLTNIDLNTTWEEPLMSWRTVSSYFDTPVKIVQKFSQKSFFGDKAGDRETWGDGASNPADIAYFICCIGPVTSTQDLSSLPCVVEIDFIVKWHEPKDFVSS